MVIITKQPISPELIINQVKTNGSGCVATYVGLIRDNSRGKPVLSVEYSDPDGTAEAGLQQIIDEAREVVDRLLQNHEPLPLSMEVERELDRIQTRAKMEV